jgi:hypothetical protein
MTYQSFLRRKLRKSLGLKLVGFISISLLLTGTAAQAAPNPDGRQASPTSTISKPPIDQPTTDPAKRGDLLGEGWQQSGDRMWTTSGDAIGFHLLVAEAKTGYTWRAAATLSEPGLEADQWIGNACVTSSGKRAVVVYAPRSFTNQQQFLDRGAFTALVDLDTGAVTKLPIQTTLAYYNPGCGVDETVALTQAGSNDMGKTRLLTLDTTTGKLSKPLDLVGQVTSAVSVKDGFVAAGASGLLHISQNGTRSLLSQSAGVPFDVKADNQGGIVFMDTDGKKSRIRRVATTSAEFGSAVPSAPVIATGKLAQMSATTSAAGKVFITGHPDQVGKLPGVITRLDAPKDAELSTSGETVVSVVLNSGNPQSQAAQPVHIQAQSLKTGKDLGFTVDPGATLTPRTSPIDDGRYCAVPRNDPKTQVYQPTPRQVEWAADMAVKGDLTITRPANWNSNGLAAYVPQQLFPSIPLKGAPPGATVPAQVLLGVFGQESNLWQAARGVMPGETGNPLIGNYYGINYYDGNSSNDWALDWTKADCGYGISQMTDGMRLPAHPKPGETEKPWIQQQAIATDYAANVAAGLQLLETKWNQLQDLGIKVNDNDPSKLENWFMTIWAYNAGYHNLGDPDVQDPNGAVGLGWGNNPANPTYDPNRSPFGTGASDFAKPQGWPYPEKVLGFAANPPSGYDSPGHAVPFFRAAYWNGTAPIPKTGDPGTAALNKAAVKPPNLLFCTDRDNCVPGGKFTPTAPGVNSDPKDDTGPCAHKNSAGEYDLKCWWHDSVTWKSDCSYTCGNEFIRFDYPTYKDEASGGNSYPPDCALAGLPGGSLIVDDIDNSVPSVRAPGCARQNAGNFNFNFGTDANGVQISKIDLHQLGSGYGGHFWYSHTLNSDPLGRSLDVTGTWSLNQSLNGWNRILVHLPDHGAETQQARYDIDLGSGSPTEHRTIPQGREQNQWVSLGVYPISGVPRVSLSSITPNEGRGTVDIAWDAVAFQPLPAKPKNIVAVLGDSFSSGEGVGNYYTESDNNHGTADWAACRRSQNAWSRQLTPPGNSQSLGTVEDTFGTQSELGFVACSGAKTWNVDGGGTGLVPISWGNPDRYDAGEGQFREVDQVDSGVLDTNTTLVALSIGGNDSNAFSNAVVSCVTLSGTPPCGSDSFMAQYKGYIDSTQPDISRVLTTIAAKAPNARILLVGYPDIFQTNGVCSNPDLNANARAMSSLSAYMAQEQQATVASLANTSGPGLKVTYADPATIFNGHGVCSDSWFHDVTLGPNGNGDFHTGDAPSPFCIWKVLGGACLSRESFHPDGNGATGYAQVLQNTLATIGYHGS